MAKRKRKPVTVTKESKQHLRAATETLTAVLTGYRQSEQNWIDDIEEAHRCLRMAFEKNDEVFEILESLNITYNYLGKQRAINNGNKNG